MEVTKINKKHKTKGNKAAAIKAKAADDEKKRNAL